MKKVILIAAVMFAAIAANAASFKWSAGNVYGSDGVTKWAGEAILYATGGTLVEDTIVATFTPTTPGTVNHTFTSDILVGGNYYDFYFVINDNGKVFTSAVKPQITAQATATAPILFGNMQSATQNAANWVAVPEPTSGLLLLLGMAGLALKRKVA